MGSSCCCENIDEKSPFFTKCVLLSSYLFTTYGSNLIIPSDERINFMSKFIHNCKPKKLHIVYPCMILRCDDENNSFCKLSLRNLGTEDHVQIIKDLRALGINEISIYDTNFFIDECDQKGLIDMFYGLKLIKVFKNETIHKKLSNMNIQCSYTENLPNV